MKATLEFNLPEEAHEFKVASNAANLEIAIVHIREQIRRWQKHGHEFKTPDEALEGVRNVLIDVSQLIEE